MGMWEVGGIKGEVAIKVVVDFFKSKGGSYFITTNDLIMLYLGSKLMPL